MRASFPYARAYSLTRYRLLPYFLHFVNLPEPRPRFFKIIHDAVPSRLTGLGSPTAGIYARSPSRARARAFALVDVVVVVVEDHENLKAQ